MISVTNVVENSFCPRFTYYEQVLGIKQYEEKRPTVLAGRVHHKKSETTNKNYIFKNLSGIKHTSQKLYSVKHDFVGIIDHAIETKNYIILVERKYTDYTIIHDTLKIQLGLLSILLEENLNKPVKNANVIFTKDGVTRTVCIDMTPQIYDTALRKLDETKQIISSGIMPESHYDSRCDDCCYRKSCEYGSLNSS